MRYGRWLGWVACWVLASAQHDVDSEHTRKVLGSSVVTSVSVIMDHGNGTRTYIADAAGHPLTQHEGPVGSPADLLAPDRYEFYTFDESGDLIKKLMTLDQIHGLIAGGDVDALDSVDSSAPTYYHAGNNGQIDVSDLEPTDMHGVHKVVENVQNVLKGELEASKNKPFSTKPISMLSVPDAASSWSILLPGVLGGAEDAMSEAVLSEPDPERISEFAVQTSVKPAVTETTPTTQDSAISSIKPTVKPSESDTVPTVISSTQSTPTKTTYDKPHTVSTTTEKLVSSVKTTPSTTEEFTTAASTKKKVTTTTPSVPVTQRRTNSPTIIHYLTIQNVHGRPTIPDRTTEKSSPAPLRSTPGPSTLSASHIYETTSTEQHSTTYAAVTSSAPHIRGNTTNTLSSGSVITSSSSTLRPTPPPTSERTTHVSSSSSQVYDKTTDSNSQRPVSTTHSTFISTTSKDNDRVTEDVSLGYLSTTYESVTPTASQVYERVPTISSSGASVSTTYNLGTPSSSQIYERIPPINPSVSPDSIAYDSVTPSASQIFERIPPVRPTHVPTPVSYIYERIPALSSSGSPISTTYNPVTSSVSQTSFERIPTVSSSGSPTSTTHNLVSPTASDVYESVTDISSLGSPVSIKNSPVTPSASLIYEIITNINSAEPLTTTLISKPQAVTENITEKSTPEPLRTTYNSISSPVSQTQEVVTEKFTSEPLITTHSPTGSSEPVSDVSERITEVDSPQLLRITLTEAVPSPSVTSSYQPTTGKSPEPLDDESSSPLSANFGPTSTSTIGELQSIPIEEGMAESLSDVLSQVTDKQNYTSHRPESDKINIGLSKPEESGTKPNINGQESVSTDHETPVHIDVSTSKYTSTSTEETFETQYTNQHLSTLNQNQLEESTSVPSNPSKDTFLESDSASFYDKSSESTASHKVTSEATAAESDIPTTGEFNTVTDTNSLDKSNETLHEVHLKTKQSEQVVKVVTLETPSSQSLLVEPNISITTYKPSTYRPVSSSTSSATAESTTLASATLSEQLLSTLTTPKITEYSTSTLINSVSEQLSDTTNSGYKPIVTTEDDEENTTENVTNVPLNSSDQSNPVVVDGASYNINDTEIENNASKSGVQSSPPELLDTENTLLKAGISAVTSILLDQQSPSEPQLPLPTDSLSQSSSSPEAVDPVSGELKHASTFGSEYDTTTVSDGDTEAYSIATATEELATTNVPVEHNTDENFNEQETSNYSSPIKEPTNDLNTTPNISESSDNSESITSFSAETTTISAPQDSPSLGSSLTLRTNVSHTNTSQTLPTKESKLSEDQSEQNITKNDYVPDAIVDEIPSKPATNLDNTKDELEFAQSIISNNTEQNLNFAHTKPEVELPKQEASLTPGNDKPTGVKEKIELKTAAPASDSKVSFLKKPATAYRPIPPPDAPLTPPTAVELHPAPHESMGLEATTAFLADDVRRFADLCNELAFRMWTSITGKGSISSRSIVLSPFAVTSLLAMVFLGARGPTSGQMNDILRLDDMVTFNPHQVLQNVTESVLNSKNFGVATAAFVRELYSDKSKGRILDFYKERAQQYYDGHVEEISFRVIGDILRRRTNLLVKRQTLGKVPEYLRGSGLHMKPPLAAFSANIFQTDCEQGSTEGRDGEMYFVVRPSTRQRRLVPVPAAVWRSGFLAGYEPGLDATAVSLGSDSVVSTILILPGQQGQVAPGDGLARLEQRLIETSYRRGGWSRLLRSLLPRPGLELQIPRYSHRSVLNMTGVLQRMGLKDLFNAGRADLRGLNGLSNDLHLSDMVQINTFSTCGEETVGARHHIETYPVSPQRMGREDPEMYPEPDEEEESPFSALPLALRPRQARLPDNPRLRFDRPFLYMIRHNPTGMILHMGRFNPRLLP